MRTVHITWACIRTAINTDTAALYYTTLGVIAKIAFQLVEGLGSVRRVNDPSTRRMKSKQLRVGKPRIFVVGRELDRWAITAGVKVSKETKISPRHGRCSD